MFCVGGTRLSCLQKLAAVKLFFAEPHGHTGKMPWNKISESDKQGVVQFLKNYSSVFGLPMPAAPRRRGENAPTYLPASCTHLSVHAEYVLAQADAHSASLRSFRRIWKRCLPDLKKFMVPTQDVCAKCESLRNQLCVEMSEQGKLDCTR